MVDREAKYIERGDVMTRIVRLVCLDLIILYIIGRFPLPLLVIPMVGCAVVYTVNEIKEIKEDGKKKHNKRNKKVTKKNS